MTKDIDLLPWILGAVAMAIVAAAVAIGTTRSSAPMGSAPIGSQIPVRAPAPTLPAVAVIEPAPPSPTVETYSAPEQVQPAAASPVQSSQIWECTINGQRTFSGKPCGDNATLRDVGPVNVMNAAPVIQSSRPYPADPGYAPDYYYPDAQETADSSYPVYIGVPYAARLRPERPRHPYDHDHDHGAPARSAPVHGVAPRGVAPRRN